MSALQDLPTEISVRVSEQKRNKAVLSACTNPNADLEASEVADMLGNGCLNGRGYFGEGIPVGQMEIPEPPYGLPIAQNPEWTLKNASGNPGLELMQNIPYRDGKYVQAPAGSNCTGVPDTGSEHPTAVAGMIGSRDPSGSLANAAEATLYYANGDWVKRDGADFSCEQIVDYVEAFEWFVEARTPFVVQSFACNPTSGFSWQREHVVDFFTRYYDMVIFRASGNAGYDQFIDGESPDPPNFADQHPAFCRSPNVMCVGSRHPSSHRVSNFTRHGNAPSNVYGNTDKEEPDLVAPGESIGVIHGRGDAASCSGMCNHTFNKVAGTSIAAPAVASMAVMTLEQMDTWQECRITEWMRANLKASAIGETQFGHPVWDPVYQEFTYQQGPRLARHDIDWGNVQEDESQGAGMPELHRMLGWCCPSEESSWVTDDDLEDVDLSDGLPVLDRVHPEISEQHPSENGVSQTSRAFVYTSSDNQPATENTGSDCEISTPSACLEDPTPKEGQRELRRIVFEWTSCPQTHVESDPTALDEVPVRPATDFNLVLETPSGDRYWMSTSFDDVSESFEFCPDESGDYKIFAVPTTSSIENCPKWPGSSEKGERKFLIETRTEVPEEDCPELRHYGRGLEPY